MQCNGVFVRIGEGFLCGGRGFVNSVGLFCRHFVSTVSTNSEYRTKHAVVFLVFNVNSYS